MIVSAAWRHGMDSLVVEVGNQKSAKPNEQRF